MFRGLLLWSSLLLSSSLSLSPDVYWSPLGSLQAAGVAQSVYRLGYGLYDQGSIPNSGSDGIFCYRDRVQSLPSLLSNGLRMCGPIPPLLQYVFMASYLVKQRKTLPLLLLLLLLESGYLSQYSV